MAATLSTPSRAVVAASRSAVGYWYPNGGGGSSDDSWRWAPYFMAVDEFYRETGDVKYRQWLQAWGDRNGWDPTEPPSPAWNPDSRAAIQVWEDSTELGVNANLAPSDAAMASDLNLPASQYWWIDSLFMGLPLWPTWAAHPGNSAYQAKQTPFYDFLKTQGRTTWRTNCTNTGLFDASEGLWWRDCMYVPQRDSLGHKVFWSRGNGWVIAAMARTLKQLPQGSPSGPSTSRCFRPWLLASPSCRGPTAWRTSLLGRRCTRSPRRATALFAYAMAYGIRDGLLDEATYLPAVTKAWTGLTSISLRAPASSPTAKGWEKPPYAKHHHLDRLLRRGVRTRRLRIARLSDTYAVDSFTRTVANGPGWAEDGRSMDAALPRWRGATTRSAAAWWRTTTPCRANQERLPRCGVLRRYGPAGQLRLHPPHHGERIMLKACSAGG